MSGMSRSYFGYSGTVTLFSDGIGEDVVVLIDVSAPVSSMFSASQ